VPLIDQHKLHKWTPEQVKTFWDYESNFPNNYFGRVCSKGFISLIKNDLKNASNILDLGCGDGALIESILPYLRGHGGGSLYGLDLSS
jgi:SAM-dependent methyltransferase